MSTGNELVNLPLAEIERIGTVIARSGLFGVKTPEQAIALCLIAQAEGLHPVFAARDYDIIQGRPAKKSEAMQRDFLSAGGTIEWLRMDDEKAEAKFSHPAGGTVTVAWDTARGEQAGLANKDMWKKYPRAMKRARVISEGVRTVWPGATSGMYPPEEVQFFEHAKQEHRVNGTVERAAERFTNPPTGEVNEARMPEEIPALTEMINERFVENLPKWFALVESGKKTTAQIIEAISTKYVLTQAQIEEIKNLESLNNEQ